MKKLTAVVIGAGSRGTTYAGFMKKMGDKFDVVGVAEPIAARRENIKNMFSLPDEACFLGYEELLSHPKLADIAIVSTMDDMHYEPAMRAIELGYNLLLEKPVAQTARECIEIANAAEKRGVKVLVCHVLRYTPFFKTIKKLVDEGAIGEVMSVIHVEAVGNIHHSHSYVRGDWHREDETTPMLLAKCCHDLDIIQWILNKPCKKVSSFGELTYFTPENAPKGAPKRCIDGGCPVAESCPYNCNTVYLDNSPEFMRRAVGRGFSEGYRPTAEELIDGMKNTNFGACVFHAGNDVVDHQVVNMEFEGGITASLSMNAFNKGGRYIRLFGTKGELYAYAADKEITLFSFDTREITKFPVPKVDETITGGHGGGDAGIVYELYDYFTDTYKGFSAADIKTSVKNHLIGFAAEKARRLSTVEDIATFCKENGFEY